MFDQKLKGNDIVRRRGQGEEVRTQRPRSCSPDLSRRKEGMEVEEENL